MKLIYVAGPYRAKTWFGKVRNIYKARKVARRLWLEGWAVICPHMNTALFDDDCPYIEGDLVMLKHCDAIYMLSSWRDSQGAILEHEEALRLGLEVIYE